MIGETNIRTVKSGVDSLQSRKKREEISIQIRKNKREDALRKRRMTAASDNSEPRSCEEVKDDDVNEIPCKLSELSTMLAAAQSNDPKQRLAGVRAVRKLLSRPQNPPVEEVVEKGFLHYLCEFLKCFDDTTLQFEAAWALTNIGSSDLTGSLVDAGCLPLLAPLLTSADPAVREQAAWCVGNIAGDCTEYRDLVLDSPQLVEGLLLNLSHPENVSMMRNVTWTVSNLCRGGKSKPELSKIAGLVPVLVNIIERCGDEETITDATWALSYVSDGCNDRIECVVRTGIAPTLVKLLHEKVEKCIAPALRTLGNIVTGSDVHTQAALDAGLLQQLVPLFQHHKLSVRKEAVWAASNVTAGTKAQITAFLSVSGLPEAVVDALANGEWSVKKEAGWTVANICTGGSREHILALVEQYGALESICGLLDCSDARIVEVLLGALESILKINTERYTLRIEECGGLELIEMLQNHESDDIYNKARDLIDVYFGSEEEEEDKDYSPEVDASANSFSFNNSKSEDYSGFPQQPQENPAFSSTGFSFNGF